MKLDLVYNYVNGSDEEWVRRRNEFALDHNNSECRFRDNHELMYSLRSVEKYAPWIRRIYILMDSRVPEWLNKDHEKIVIVDHSEFMPEELLPCYNSNVIEYYLDRIPGLSEVFLYANDDMFFGKQVSEKFFVDNGKPIVRMVEREINPFSYYRVALKNSQRLIEERFGRRYDLIPIHNIDVYSKDAIVRCKAEFDEEFRTVSGNRMRMNNDIQRSIFHYYMIEKNLCILKTYRTHDRLVPKLLDIALTSLFASKRLDYLFCKLDEIITSEKARLYFALNPRLVCFNDSENATEEDRHRYQELMLKKFPEKSSFEN